MSLIISTLKQTCRRLKSLVDVSPTLRLIVELGLEGFRLSDSWLSGDSSCPPTQLRQEFTLEQQKKKKFKFTHHVTGFFPATRGSNASSQFINGILGYVTPANGSEDNQDLIFWDLRCSIDSLPSTRRRYPPAAENWIHLHENLIDPLTRHRLEADLMYFTWDQSQDLLVLFERGVEM